MTEECSKHIWGDGKSYKVIGYSDKAREGYKLPYIVVQCVACGENFIYDEAGNYYEHRGEFFPFTKAS